MTDIEQAKNDVMEMFENLAPMVQEIVDKYAKNLDKIIFKISDMPTITNDELRDMMLSLSVESYMFGMLKDASLLKEECATTLMKEAQAIAYNGADGTQVVKQNYSIIKTVDKQVVNMLYGAVADLMKTKLDEAHRLVNTLNSILISRNAEAKLNIASKLDGESRRQLLNE